MIISSNYCLPYFEILLTVHAEDVESDKENNSNFARPLIAQDFHPV